MKPVNVSSQAQVTDFEEFALEETIKMLVPYVM